MAKAERELLGRLADSGCALCRWLGYGETPAQIHHIRTGYGMGQRAPHSKAIPLCHEHHQGAEGIHGMGLRAWERFHGISELDLMKFAHDAVDIGRSTV